MVSVVVVVVIVLFIVVTFERPAPWSDSTREKLCPAFTIFHLGTSSSVGLVQLNWTPLRVWVVPATVEGLIYPLRSADSILCPDAEYENPELYWCEVIVSLMTLCEVELCVLDPERNCGTTGVARVLTGNINKTNRQSLVNGYSHSCWAYAASAWSTSSTGMYSRWNRC